MINPQELRIGNIIYSNTPKGILDKIQPKISKIIEINRYGNVYYETLLISPLIEHPYEQGETMLNCIKPIPITEEILLDFGFVIEKSETHLIAFNEEGYSHELQINRGVKDKSWRISKYKGGYKHIYYVHQLQNLYFALTGEELIFKNK